MAHEEALLVVVGVNKPTGDTFWPMAANLAAIRVEDIDPMNRDLYPYGQ